MYECCLGPFQHCEESVFTWSCGSCAAFCQSVGKWRVWFLFFDAIICRAKTHDTMFKNNASDTNTGHTAKLGFTDLLSIFSCPRASPLLLVDSVAMWDGVGELLSFAPSEEFNTMNLYFFQLRTLGRLVELGGDAAPRLQLLDSAGELGWQSDLRGLLGPLVWHGSMLSTSEFRSGVLPVSLGSSWTEEHRWTVPLLSGLRGSSVSLGPSRGSAVWRGVLLAGYYAGLRDLPERVCGVGDVHGER